MFAVGALSLLGVRLDEQHADACAEWARHSLQEATLHENAEAVCACVKTLWALGRLTDKEKGYVRNWTRPNLSQLALINPTGKAEWALHVVETASLVFDHFETDVLSQPPVQAAAARIRSALLADLRHI